jgi:predicted Na+-dependent transporter
VTLAVVALIYAAISGSNAVDALLPALAASATFLAVSTIAGLAATRLVNRQRRSAIAFAISLRDFAVAATLATQAFGTEAPTASGIYGVLMLIAGAAATAALRHR